MPSLAIKYRPTTFEDVCEQSAITSILSNMCKAPELENRNILLIGPAGTGKTTSSRIVGSMLNNSSEGIIEIDAASHNGVEAMRELVQEARSFPVGKKYKIFIIDEAHVLSNQAWQTLLKVLEEGAGRSVFIFCTTNPEKIPATILSRVQTFQLSKISLTGIFNRLKYVLDSEIKEGRAITYEDEAVNYIAKLANGGMRDALTLLDKALTFSSDINSSNILQALNIPSYDDYFDLLGAYAKKDNEAIAATIHRVYNSGINFVQWFERFHSFVMNIVKFIFLQDINATMIPNTYSSKISKYNSAHSAVCLRLASKLLSLIDDLKSTQYLEEVALTYLCSIPKKEAK